MTQERSRFALMALVLGLGLGAPAQDHNQPTHLVWLLDRGMQQGGGESLHAFQPDGQYLTTVPLAAGGGQPRGLAGARNGNLWMARGNFAEELGPDGMPTGRFIAGPGNFSQAQDVVELPNGNICVAWGAQVGNSGISVHEPVNLIAVNIVTGPTGFVHPRRVVVDPESSIVYIATSTGSSGLGTNGFWILDLSAPGPVNVVNLSVAPANVFPIGLAFDGTHDGLWVTSDFSGDNEIGFVDATSGAYSTEITFPGTGFTGMTAPAGLYYDRMGRLWAASRDRNGGTPGAYVFDGADLAAPSPPLHTGFAIGNPNLNNIMDVALQAIQIDCTTPTLANEPVVYMGQNNVIGFNAPTEGGCVYCAAFSLPWNGAIDPALELGPPDTRGLPLMFDDLFLGSANVASPNTAPPFGGPNLSQWGLGITGFIGTLDLAGNATGSVDMSGLTLPSLDGLKLSFGFLTAGPTSSGVGQISQPKIVTVRMPNAP